jgi:hypothetical protein
MPHTSCVALTQVVEVQSVVPTWAVGEDENSTPKFTPQMVTDALPLVMMLNALAAESAGASNEKTPTAVPIELPMVAPKPALFHL